MWDNYQSEYKWTAYLQHGTVVKWLAENFHANLCTFRPIALPVVQWRPLKRYCCSSLIKVVLLLSVVSFIHPSPTMTASLICFVSGFSWKHCISVSFKTARVLPSIVHMYNNPTKTTVVFMVSDFWRLLSINMWSGCCWCSHTSAGSRQSAMSSDHLCARVKCQPG